jgi:hypothetical protein
VDFERCIENKVRWRSWLRHRGTGRKVVGSIPDCVLRIFLLHNHSGCTAALGSTQPLTEIFPWSKGGQCVGLTTIPPSSANCLEPSGHAQASKGVALLTICTACKYSLIRRVLCLF